MRRDDEEKNVGNDTATVVSNQPTPSEKESILDEQQHRTTMDKVRYFGVFTGIIMSMFVMSLNSTVVAPAMSIIATQLNALEQQTWIATSFMVAMVRSQFFFIQFLC